MNTYHLTSSDEGSGAPAEAVGGLYQRLQAAWNNRDSHAFAALFAPESEVVGFDGSRMHGPAEIETTLSRIFADHQTSAYIWIIRDVRLLAPTVAVLHAVSGMVPPGQTDLNPAVNAIQVLVAVKGEEGWRIAHYQNTPAQFHGRPDLSAALTEELRKRLWTG